VKYSVSDMHAGAVFLSGQFVTNLVKNDAYVKTCGMPLCILSMAVKFRDAAQLTSFRTDKARTYSAKSPCILYECLVLARAG
jgi:hypothetical protein